MPDPKDRPKTARTSRIFRVEDSDGDTAIGQTLLVSEEVIVNDKPRRGRYRRERGKKMFTMFNNDSMIRADLTQLQLKIIMAILADTNIETHYSRITVGQLASELDVAHQHISRALKDLVDRQFVFKVDGRIRVSAWIGFRGDMDAWDDLEMDEPHPVWNK